MAHGSGSNSSPLGKDNDDADDLTASGKQKVAKTMMDINMDDLINPLTEGLISPPAVTEVPQTAQEKNPPSPEKAKGNQPAPRQMPKTMLEISVSNLDLVAAEMVRQDPVVPSLLEMLKAVKSKSASSKTAEKLMRLKPKKFSKTMLEFEHSFDNTENQLTDSGKNCEPNKLVQSGNSSKPPFAKALVREQFVARTMLDHSMLAQTVSQSQAKKELEVSQRLKEKSNEPPKPAIVPIEGDKLATPCAWTWAETDSKEKYRFCGKCQTPVYNLAGMERPEAEALIFNRENRKKFTLFKRADGKFMIVNCPVQVKRKKDIVLLSLGTIVFVVGVVTVLILFPPPPPPPPPLATSTKAPDLVRNSPSSPEGVNHNVQSSTTGSNRNGASFILPAPNTSTTSSTSTAPDPDENGQFWRY